jgi:NCAIR mutase (PurE)-related protein
MTDDRLRDLLTRVASGEVPTAEALEHLRRFPVDDLGFARLDTHRPLRQGMIEAVYAAGKTADQVVAILERSVAAHGAALATRVPPATAEVVLSRLPGFQHSETARLVWRHDQPPTPHGLVAVVAAGTSDLPVLEEAALTLEFFGDRVLRVTDVGVAGLHRLLPHVASLREARAVVVVAGMEGALPSVIGGLVDRPVLAVPTSVGYGAHLGGFTALLAMLNSCASGVAVMNIDNGYGAACAAHRINRLPGEAP